MAKILTEQAHFIWLVIRNAHFSLLNNLKYLNCGQKVCDAFHFLLDDIFIKFGSKMYRQILGILMSTNCAHFVAELFLFCYERDFMLSLTKIKQM